MALHYILLILSLSEFTRMAKRKLFMLGYFILDIWEMIGRKSSKISDRKGLFSEKVYFDFMKQKSLLCFSPPNAIFPHYKNQMLFIA